MKNIGFIGLGTMGGPMASNLLKHGFTVTVYNRTAGKTEALEREGARTAATPAEAAQGADVVITMISDDAALREVVFADNGLIHSIRSGMTIIDCSTVSPQLSKELAQRFGEHGAPFLDAPVTGSKPAAIDGTLVFMIGGARQTVDEQRDVLEAMGSKLLHMGPNGSGSIAKLAHNTMVGIHNVALAEGMSIASRGGLDPAMFLDLVLAGSAGSKAAELKGRKIIDHDYTNQFSLKLMLKDLKLSSELSAGLNIPTPLLDSARNVFQTGLGMGYGELDLSSVTQCYEQWMGARIGESAPQKSK